MKKILGVLLLFIFASADAALIDRGGGFIYDDVQNITWTQDANINGFDTWYNHGAWAAGLSIVDTRPGAGGVIYSDWRLPTTSQPDPTCSAQTLDFFPQGFGTGCTGSEMGHLFNVDGISAGSPGLFTNVQSHFYWSGTGFDPNLGDAWLFHFGNGVQGTNPKFFNVFAWAVRPGDVSVVPVPAALWLFGSGLLGLLGLVRRKR